MRTLLVLLLTATTAAAQTVAGDRLTLTTGPCTLHSESGAPATGFGAVCDVYVRTDSPYTIYVKTAASTWTAVVQMPSSAAAGDLIAASSATVSARIAAVAAGQVLASNGTGAVPVYTASPSLTAIGGAANLTLNPTGDVVLGPAGADILPDTGYSRNLGALTNKYLTLHAAELWVETLVAQNTLATIGGRVLVGPTTTLTADLGSGATSISVKHNNLANGDRVLLEANGKVEWMAVTSASSGSGPYTYSVTRNLDGSGGGADAWTAGDAVFNTGTTNSGFIDLYSAAGVVSGSGPTIVGNVRTGTTYSNIEPRWAIGNLNGLYGYSATTYGVALGDNANAWVKVDPTNGVRIGENTTTYFQVDPSGNASFSGSVSIGAGRNMLTNSFGVPTTTTDSEDGDGADWTSTYTDSGASLYLGCNPDDFRLEEYDATAPYDGAPINGSCYVVASGTPANGTFATWWGPKFPAVPNQRFEWSFYCGVVRAGSLYAILWFMDAAGNYVDSTVSAVPCSSATSGGRELGDWGRIGVIASTSNSNARWVLPHFLQYYNGGGTDPYTFIMRMFFGEASATQASLSPWAPGGVTRINGGNLATDLVLANNLIVTDGAAGTGAQVAGITGYVSGSDDVRFWAGDTYANRGSAEFRVTEAGVLTATSGTIGGWTLNSSYITGGTSGMAATDGGGSDVAFWAGDTYANRASADFVVYRNGNVTISEVIGDLTGSTDGYWDLGAAGRDWGELWIEVGISLGGCYLLHGSGTPEGAVTAPQCSLFLRKDGGTSTTLYVKTSGSGNTGWTAK